MNVKFFDVATQDAPIQQEIRAAINRVLDKGIFVNGPETAKFEEEWAAENGVKYCVLTSNGTSALELALKSLEIQGKSIATTANSFFATASCIATENYTHPFFIDTDHTCNIDLDRLESAHNYDGIIAVNLYGNPCDHETLQRIARGKRVPLILDLAQSHYTKYKSKNPTEFCDVGCFSFYTTKTLGCYGECGALVTDDENVMLAAKCLRNHGRDEDGYSHSKNSGNHRGSEIQSAVLRVKNLHKDYYINERIKVANRYKTNLSSLSYLLLHENWDATRIVNYVFPIFTPRRNELKAYLEKEGIQTMIHYPTPLPAQKVYQNKYQMTAYPNAVRQCNETLSLPYYAGIPEDQVDFVSEKILRFFQ